MRTSFIAAGLLAALTLAPAAQTPVQAQNRSGALDIVDTAIAAGSFKTLAAALTEADLVSALRGDGPFTVFAPTDAAFAKLPKGTVEALLRPENRDRLIAILTYHVVPGRVPARAAAGVDNASTLNGQRVNVDFRDGSLRIDEAVVQQADIDCSNGVIHVIDRVLLPEEKDLVGIAGQAGTFKTLLAAATAAGLAETLAEDGPFTVFAPNDEAFAKLPSGTVESLLKPENRDRLRAVLLLHVVAGRVYADQALEVGEGTTAQGSAVKFAYRDGALRVNDAVITATDIDASNGVVHVIDSVLLPPSAASASRTQARDLIQLAITRGAPLFNNGQQAACAAIYEVAATGLLGFGDAVIDDGDRRDLTEALRRARGAHDSSRSAWILRDVLDEVYASVSGPSS